MKIHVLFALNIIFCISSSVLAQEKPLIFPLPQELELTNDQFVFDETVSIIVPPDVSEKDLALARFLIGELSDRHDLALKIETRSDIPKDKKTIILGSFENPLIKQFCEANKIALTSRDPGPEGYILKTDGRSIVIGGSDDQGAFYGLQSLRQMLESGKGKSVKGVRVRDWPAFPFRAIRLYVPGPENMAFFRRFMRDFMALYKYNKVVLEVNCMRLDKHPEVNTGWIEFTRYLQYSRSNSTKGLYGEEKNSTHFDAGDGFILEKNDIRDIVKQAELNFIEVIPEIPSLTHGYYLLTKHPELAEYPGDPWPDTYCPSNPKSYELMFDVYDEYLEVIKPKMVHIGHDEWWGAPLDACPLCRGKDYSKLYAGDVVKIHDYFSKKGIKVAMWGDYLLESVRSANFQEWTSSTGVKYKTPGAVRPEVVRESIPKDILLFNWFWLKESREQELKQFGFKQIYGNFTPNISNWENRIRNIDLAGGAPSSWTATNEFNIGKDIMLDFLGCSNLLWSKHLIPQPEMPRVVGGMMPSIRARLKGKLIPSSDGDEVVPVDISSKFNLPLNSKSFQMNLTTMKSGMIQNESKPFNLPNITGSSTNIAAAVGVQGTGENLPTRKVEGIAIHEDVSSLIFLHSCAAQAKNQKAYFNVPNTFDSSDLLGYYEIVYEDGYKITVPVQYGVNILEWNAGGENSLDKREGDTGAPQLAYAYEADPVSVSNSKENPITFYAFEWTNPRFGKVIKEVNLIGTENYQALQQDYAKPVVAPMPGNAILLMGISKVKKRDIIQPRSPIRLQKK